MKVTAHFRSEEFCCRDGTPYPREWVKERLLPLCNVLEVVRRETGGPIVISSGYRTPAYNARIRGARASRHMHGDAADVIAKGWSPARLHALLLELHLAGRIRLGGLGHYPSFTHLDLRPGDRLARWGGSRAGN